MEFNCFYYVERFCILCIWYFLNCNSLLYIRYRTIELYFIYLFFIETLKKDNETEEEEEEKTGFLKIESVKTMTSLHSASDSDSQDSIIRRKDNRVSPAIVSSDSEEEQDGKHIYH